MTAGSQGSVSNPPAAGLRRILTLPGAVVVGVGSMVGAGIFAAFAPAAEAAGSWLLLALALAAIVAYVNAMATAQLAAQHPTSGGVYAYGRAQMNPAAGLIAGWGFVLGKTASTAAMALAAAAYLLPTSMTGSLWMTLLALLLLIAVNVINALGVSRTVQVTAVLLTVVLIALATVVITVLSRGDFSLNLLQSPLAAEGVPFTFSLWGVLQAAGVLFFAFAGYARIATLGEEVRHPSRTIPRAISVALAMTVALYAVMAVVLLGTLGPAELAAASAPVAALVAQVPAVAVLARIAAALAALGALLGLTAGLSRTVFAMARDHPKRFGALAHIHPQRGVPVRAQVPTLVGGMLLVLIGDLTAAIAVSSMFVLIYYFIANGAAFTQTGDNRRHPRWMQVVGMVLCGVLSLVMLSMWVG